MSHGEHWKVARPFLYPESPSLGTTLALPATKTLSLLLLLQPERDMESSDIQIGSSSEQMSTLISRVGPGWDLAHGGK